jgi:hypothetical protein
MNQKKSEKLDEELKALLKRKQINLENSRILDKLWDE